MNHVERWAALCRRADATAHITSSFHALVAQYDDPHRAYHNLSHVTHCLTEFDLLSASTAQPEAVEFAIWFHDAVYDTHRVDNEQQSADFATHTLSAMEVSVPVCERIATLILLTRHVDVPEDIDGQIIIDVDLAILASPRQRFDDYEAQIRQEYAWVDDALFWSKRREFLVAMLQRPYIFYTTQFQARYEAAARDNLRHAILHAEQLLAEIG